MPDDLRSSGDRGGAIHPAKTVPGGIMEGMESQIIRPGHLTAHQTARLLGVELDAVRQLVKRGRLKRSGGSPRQPWYAVADVQALDAERRALDTA